jgi:hypothetical protein
MWQRLGAARKWANKFIPKRLKFEQHAIFFHKKRPFGMRLMVGSDFGELGIQSPGSAPGFQ